MSSSWNWPGARWWRCDLHLHTPASDDYKQKEITPAQWVDAAVAADLDVVAVTDHDTGGWVDKLRAAAVGRDLTLFAGVEVTSNEGIHVLVLRDETAGTAKVEELLTQLRVPLEPRGRPEAKSKTTATDCLRASGSPDHRSGSEASWARSSGSTCCSAGRHLRMSAPRGS